MRGEVNMGPVTIRRAAGVSLLAVLAAAGAPLRAQATADGVMKEMGLSESERKHVLEGEFVTVKTETVSERDLTFAIAFLVKASPEDLRARVVTGKLITADPQVQAYGTLSGEGTAGDLATLTITDEEARALTGDVAGGATNFSAEERAAFAALKGAPTPAVLDRLRQTLLARYRAYRAGGSGGIAPYDRGGGRSADLSADLSRATDSARLLKTLMPAFHATLAGYPKAPLPGMQEAFFWLKSIIRGKATYVLAQVLGAADGDGRAVVRREFYASAAYNGEQSVAGFLPVAQGTVVVCLSHAFSDQVAGAGGSTKRSIGSHIMAGQMKDVFAAGRKTLEK
jgi:hypothetical protein